MERAKDLLIHFPPERGYKLTELDVESVQENLNMYYEKLKEVKQNV